MNAKEIVAVYHCCLIVKGHKKSVIIDYQRKKYFWIKNILVDFIEDIDGCLLENINEKYSADIDVLKEYMDFLLENEIIFFCNSQEEYDRFPPINLEWKYPAHITNAVVEIESELHIQEFHRFKNTFFIPYVQYIIYSEQDVSSLEGLIKLINSDKYINGYQILFGNTSKIPKDIIVDLAKEYPLLETIIVFNSNKEEVIDLLNQKIIFTKQRDYNNTCCGNISIKYFNLQLEHFTESQKHNTCLNRKVAIDAEGNIKNCPSMSKSYGNIKDTKLTDVVNNPEFQKLWYINKGQINVCKDCEFRHICTDCRAYLENPEDMYSKPLKCGYNPYLGEWESWKESKIKKQAIQFYNL